MLTNLFAQILESLKLPELGLYLELGACIPPSGDPLPSRIGARMPTARSPGSCLVTELITLGGNEGFPRRPRGLQVAWDTLPTAQPSEDTDVSVCPPAHNSLVTA